MNGNHRGTGVLLLSERTEAKAADLEDVAPTVLSVLGVAGPPMDGHSLLGAVPEAAGGQAGAPAEARPYTPEEEAAIEARLRDLGYFE